MKLRTSRTVPVAARLPVDSRDSGTVLAITGLRCCASGPSLPAFHRRGARSRVDAISSARHETQAPSLPVSPRRIGAVSVPAPGRRAILIIFATVLIDTIGFGIIVPVLPRLLMELTGEDLGGASVYSGLLFFSFALAQFFC